MHHLSKVLDICMNKYDNILFLGDFNSETSENYLDDFCNVYILWNIVTEPTCFNNSENPSCIDLFLINCLAIKKKKNMVKCRYFRLPINGSYGIESFFTRNKNQKSFNTESTTILTTICFERK